MRKDTLAFFRRRAGAKDIAFAQNFSKKPSESRSSLNINTKIFQRSRRTAKKRLLRMSFEKAIKQERTSPKQ